MENQACLVLAPRHRAALLQVCRTLPWALSKYRLDELTTVRELQKVIEKRFRDNWFVRDPRVRCLALGCSWPTYMCAVDIGVV